MIEIDTLTHIYPGSRRQPPRKALESLSLSIEAGEFCILSGPNGSGKSTLFRILCGLMLPSGGAVRIGGHDLLKDPDSARAAMGVVFQSPAVDKQLSVGENLDLQAALYGLSGADYRERRAEALDWTDIKERTADRVETLSGGLARQVELAKVMLARPAVLLLDEPTTGLDPNSRRNFLTALARLQKDRGMTVLMTTHVFAEAEDADRVAIMKAGHLLAFDTPSRLKARVGREMVVAKTGDPEALRDAIERDLSVRAMIHDDEVRIEDLKPADSLPLLEKVLDRYRDRVTSVAVKQPGLEDVFVHVTREEEQTR